MMKGKRFRDFIMSLLRTRIKIPMTSMESIFYAWFSTIFTSDDKIIFKLKANSRFRLNLLGKKSVYYRINSYGCRGEEFKFEANKDNLEKRVLLLGDSWTFGFQVVEEETYVYKLKELLSFYYNRKYKVFVINAGCPGYSSTQGLYYLKEIINFYKPDWIIIQLGRNDKNYSNRTDREEICSPFLVRKIRNFLRKNTFNNLLMKIYFRIRYKTLKRLSNRFPNEFDGHSVDIDKVINLCQKKGIKVPILLSRYKRRVSPEEFRDNCQEIKRISSFYNARVIFIPPFVLVDGNKLMFDKDYFYGEPYINPFEEFYKEGIKNVFMDKVLHLKPKGHSIVANLLFKKMTELGFAE